MTATPGDLGGPEDLVGAARSDPLFSLYYGLCVTILHAVNWVNSLGAGVRLAPDYCLT